MRVAWLAGLMISAAALAGCDRGSPGATPTAGAAPTATRVRGNGGGDFVAFQGGGSFRGVVEADLAPPLKLRWKFKTPKRSSFEGGVAIVGESVYAADDDGFVHALGLADGKERWKFETKGSVQTAPLVLKGLVVIGDDMGVLYAIDAETGKARWTFGGDAPEDAKAAAIHTVTDENAPIHSSPNTDGERIYFGNHQGTFRCLSVDGKEIWKGNAGAQINGAAAVTGGKAYLGSCRGQLMAFTTKDGEVDGGADMLPGGSPAVDGDLVVVGTNNGRIVCMDLKSFDEKWTFEIEGGPVIYATPAVLGGAGGVVVVGSPDRVEHCLELATGKERWHFAARAEMDSPALIVRPPSGGNGGGAVAYVGGRDHHFYGLDVATGKKVYDFTADKPIIAPAAVGHGVIVFGDQGGGLYCLEGE